MMKLSTLVITVFCFGVLSIDVKAQEDRHFSMFYGNTLELNPAASGMYSGRYQFFANYRNQWSAVNPNLITTMSASANGRVYEIGQGDSFIGGGLGFYNDVAGVGKMKTTALRLSASYAVEVQKDQFLSGGVQLGMIQRSLDFSNFTWSSQWDGVEFNTGVLSGEDMIGASTTGLDVNAGIYYFGAVNDGLTIDGGVATHHLTTPNIGVVLEDENLLRKYVVNVGANFAVPHSKIGFSPHAFAFFQGPNQEITFGTDVKYFIKESSKYTGYSDETSVSLGAYYRTGDAVYSTLFFNTSGFSFGFSYDFNTSGLSKATNGLGGMELMLRYRLGFQARYSSFR